MGGGLVTKDSWYREPSQAYNCNIESPAYLTIWLSSLQLSVCGADSNFFGLFSVHITNPWESNYDAVVLMKYFVTQVCAFKKKL